VKLDVLAIAAHPDDIEITCGGLRMKMADMGKITGILDLTEGEMGTLGTPATRRQEAEEAGRMLGLAVRENLRLPDSELEPTVDNRKKIAAVIRTYKPQTIILPYKHKQRHPDHRMASVLGYDACYLAGLAKAKIPGDPHRPHKIIYASSFLDAPHSFFVDITDQFERKKQAVAAYKSQFTNAEQPRLIFKPGHDIFTLMETFHRKYGVEVDCRFAEAFWMAEPILLDDPTIQPVRSI